MKPSEHLIAAKALIADPANWLQGAMARDEFGSGVGKDDASACKFCMLGAIARASGRFCTRAEQVMRNAIRGSVVNFNDEHTHAEVMAMFDRAIALAQAGAA